MTAGRICLVTGASRGIGRWVVERLVADGHKVAMAARSKQTLDELAATASGTAMAIAADVTQPDEVEQMFRQIEARWGTVEVLVSNAGFGTAAPLENTTDEMWQRALDLNLTAPFRCIRRAAPGMLESGWGRIVVIASVVAKRGEAQVSAYTASKHGVLGLVRSAAAEYARRGITVNAVCPGYVDTPMTDQTVEDIRARTGRSAEDARKTLAFRQPIGRLIDPAEVAEAVHFCIINGAISGQGINVDGGAVQS